MKSLITCKCTILGNVSDKSHKYIVSYNVILAESNFIHCHHLCL